MMQKNTKKWASALCAAVVIAIMILYVAVILFAVLSESMNDFAAVLFVVLFVGIILLCIFGVLIALRQRMKEIDCGEEEDAKIY